MQFNQHSLQVKLGLQKLAFWLGSVFVGISIFFLASLSEWAASLHRQLVIVYPWTNFVLPPVGLGITAWLTFRFFPDSERSGIPQIKMSMNLYGYDARQVLALKTVLAKFCLPLLGLFFGATVGFGGPAVHIGGAILASLNKIFKTSLQGMEKNLLIAGSGAGFAAIFGTPLAGILFAFEEIARDIERKISTLVFSAIMLSGITVYALTSNNVYDNVAPFTLLLKENWLTIPICGIFGGLMGAFFSKLLVLGSRILTRLNSHKILTAILCGFGIAVINYYSQGATAGTGQLQTEAILNNVGLMQPEYPFLKLFATAATFFSGIPSGMFVPSISIGAGFGAELAAWYPALAPASIIILLTMTAYFAGVFQLPLTSSVMVMELTNNHTLLIPLMASSLIAAGISKLINQRPIFEALCEQCKTSS
jgi:H+/Cl- antiporter ClcA